MENAEFILIDLIEQMSNEKNVHLKPKRLACDIMNTKIKTLTLDHTVNQCLEFMKSHQVRHILILDIPYEGETKPYFVGVVSERDVLRLSAPLPGKNGKLTKDQQALQQPLMKIVTRKPKFVTPQTPVPQVITTMTSNHIDIVPVLDGDDLVGVITTTDLIKNILDFEETIHELCPMPNQDLLALEDGYGRQSEMGFLQAWVNREVQEIMTEQVISLNPQDDIAKAMQVMQENKFRHIPIVDEDDRCVGLISDRDILRNLPHVGRQSGPSSQKFRDNLFSSNFWSTNFLMPIESIMTRDISYISADCKICQANHILLEKRISCLPIIDENNKIQGIITVMDMLHSLLAAYQPTGKTSPIPMQNRIR